MIEMYDGLVAPSTETVTKMNIMPRERTSES